MFVFQYSIETRQNFLEYQPHAKNGVRLYCEELTRQLRGIGIPDILDRLAFGGPLPPYVRAYVISIIRRDAAGLLR